MTQKFAFVLVHGLLGFDKMGPSILSISYFRGIRNQLAQTYDNIHSPQIPANGSLKQRAAALASYLEKLDADYICIIAHSMGGLDARYVISHLDPKQKIKHLITVGTPHYGAPLANWVINEPGFINGVLKKISSPAIYDLTVESCKNFNQEVLDREDVYYESYAGNRPPEEMAAWFQFQHWAQRMQSEYGSNDGQVTVNSAQWGHFNEPVKADHFELIGWNVSRRNKQIKRPFKHKKFYQTMTESAYRRFKKQ